MSKLVKIVYLISYLPAVLFSFFSALRRRRSPITSSDRVLLYLSEVMWDEVWQRPQELAQRLSAEIPTIYVSPVQLHRWLFSLKSRWKPVRVVLEGGRKICVLSPLIFPGHYRLRVVYALNCFMLGLLLRKWIHRCENVYCITDSPFAWPVIKKLFFAGGNRCRSLRRLHYDVIDDFPAFGWAPGWARAYDNKLLGLADGVTTGTYELWQLHRSSRPDAEFIPCGVDYDAFNKRAPGIPPDLAPLPEPRLGYIGSVSDRLDYELIVALAERFRHASVVLVGPIRMSEERLPLRPNIFYLGLKPHSQLPAYAQHFAVALIPFVINESTVKLNPVKTLEYLAAGIPVVSTAIPDVMRFFSHAVYIAKDHDEFLRYVEEAIEFPDIERIRNGVELARTSSWQEMAHRMASRILTDPIETGHATSTRE
ncbi:MAG: glycosyltransferase [Candidatus Sumerlaeaceae bacterium]|nr:glycosyltransferase [Candidatus Sumerlaeaceae bacterium]